LSPAATGSSMSNQRGMKSGPTTPTAFITDPSPCRVHSIPRSVKHLSVVRIPGSTFKLDWGHEYCGQDAVARRAGTADLATTVDDDPQVAASAQRTVAARVRHQPLRVSDHGVSVGNAGIDAADERTGHDHRQL